MRTHPVAAEHENIKTVIVAPSLPPQGAGGVATSHYHLYRCLKQRGEAVTIATFNEQQPHLADIEKYRFGATQRQRRLLSLLCALYLRLRGANHKGAYQLFDIIASVPGVIRLNRQLRLLKPSQIIIPDHGAPGLFLETGDAQVTLVTHHNPSRFNDNSFLGQSCPTDIRQAMALEQLVLRKVDRVVAPSRYMAGVFKDCFRFVGPVEVIPNPVDLIYLTGIRVIDLRQRLGLPSNAPLIYIPSAGSSLKGACYVPEIIARITASHPEPIGFYLSGDIPKELQAVLHSIPEHIRVHTPGQLTYECNIALMKSCSFGISPTLIESFGMSILEANLCGIPMVVFGVGGTPELVSNGLNGFTVPCHDIEGLCNAAEQLLEGRYCHELSESTFAHTQQRFNPQAMVDRYLAFCHSSSRVH